MYLSGNFRKVDQHHLLNYLLDFITEERFQRFNDILQHRTNHFTVATEDIFQAHNASAVVRSCDVFGIQQAHLIEEKFGKRLDKNIAMGAEKWVDTFRYQNNQDCIDALRAQGYQIIATTPHNDSCLLNDFDVTQKSAFFFGTERKGLSEEVLQQADGFLKIPMVGFTESLNISVSVAIILHAVTQKLKNSNVAWQLSEAELLTKQIDWAQKSIRSIEDVMQRYHELYS
ncbi:tRNA (guanosine-2'-O-)-methyltransferase [Pustulibacterium marinum]|uniref:tRNA (guanosine(18)-2'-O)-methyltransferase n=1 Tax=Pustulibacterium marinum TaxID=1224947 RepID=A0A1I7FSN3_9FLAO|nr:RNA methyltransferase [Pustulibacterium marinum]SFU39200.1 tRNA (guanosine-2'-O-)-methyltransferase [Pustulibacterium marinum]